MFIRAMRIMPSSARLDKVAASEMFLSCRAMSAARDLVLLNKVCEYVIVLGNKSFFCNHRRFPFDDAERCHFLRSRY
jgi:hypothetical protein